MSMTVIRQFLLVGLTACLAATDTVTVIATKATAEEQGRAAGQVTFHRTGSTKPLEVRYRITGTGLSDLHEGRVTDVMIANYGDGYLSPLLSPMPTPTGRDPVYVDSAATLSEPIIAVGGRGGVITGVNLVSPGSGYDTNKQPRLTVTDLNGTGAGADINPVLAGLVSGATINTPGAGYAVGNVITFTDGAPITNAVMRVASVDGAGGIAALVIVSAGGGYAAPPTTFTAAQGTAPSGPGSGASITGQLSYGVYGFMISSGGQGYVDPVISIEPPAIGSPASAAAVVSGSPLDSASLVRGGYSIAMPLVSVDSPFSAGGSMAVVRPVVVDGTISRLVVEDGGTGYATPVITVVGTTASATVRTRVRNGVIIDAFVVDAGDGVVAGDISVVDVDGVPKGAVLTPTVIGGRLVTVRVKNGGAGHVCPTVHVSPITADPAVPIVTIENGKVVLVSVDPVEGGSGGSGYTAFSHVSVNDLKSTQDEGHYAEIALQLTGGDYYVIPQGGDAGGGSSMAAWVDPATGDLVGSVYFPVASEDVTLDVVPMRNGVGGARDIVIFVEPPRYDLTEYAVGELSSAQVRIADMDDEAVVSLVSPVAYPIPPSIDQVPYPTEVDGRAEIKITISGDTRARRQTVEFSGDAVLDADCLLALNSKPIPDTASDYVVALNAEREPPYDVGPAKEGDTKIPVSSVLSKDLVVMFEGPGAGTRTSGIYVVTGSSKATDELNATITITPALRHVDCVAGETRVRVLGLKASFASDSLTAGSLEWDWYSESSTLFFFAFPYQQTAPRGVRILNARMVETDDYRVRTPTTATMMIADTSVVARVRHGANAGQPGTAGYVEVSLSQAFPKDISVPFSILGSSTALLTVPDDLNTVADEFVQNDCAVTGVSASTRRGSIIIPAGSTTGRITVTPSGSNVRTADVVLDIKLEASTDYQFGPQGTSAANTMAQVTVSPVPLTHNGAPVRVAFLSSSVVSAAEPATNGQVTVALVDATGNPLVGDYLDAPISIAYSATGSAVAGVNYQALSGSVTMRQGASSIIIPIAVVDDGVVGTDLSVVLNLTSGASYQVGGVATATIPVLDGGPRLSVTTTLVATRPDVVTGENGRFTITNARPTANSIVVFYSVGGTAVAGTDYTVLPGQVTMPASATEVYVDVIPLQGDKSARSLTLTLDSPKPATYVVQTGSGSATMAIQAPAQPTNANHELVYVGVARLADGRENPLTNGSFQLFLANNAGVALTAAMSADLSVSIDRTGTAVPGTNFTSIPVTVTIPAGSLSVPVSVPVINDGAKNGDTQVDITVGTYPSLIQTASVIIYADTTDNSGGGTPRPTVGSGGSGGCGVGSGIGLILAGFGVALAARLRRRRDAA